jgi:hypothetical protein
MSHLQKGCPKKVGTAYFEKHALFCLKQIHNPQLRIDRCEHASQVRDLQGYR